MSDIFLSYTSADVNRAKALAYALQKKGWQVWWDRKIPPGRSFDEVIQEALDASQCVIVLWSKTSIGSDWVKEEATEGKRRNILVPCLLDKVNIPLGFSRIQAANLIDWQGKPDHAGFESLCATVVARIGSATTSVESGNEPRELDPEAETQTHAGSGGSINEKPSMEPEMGLPSASPQRTQIRPRLRKPMWAILMAVLLVCVYLFGRSVLTPPPPPPKADAGPDRVVGRSTMITLEASTQDVMSREDIDYLWTQVAGPSIGALAGSLPKFKTPDEITALAFELIATSKGGQSEPNQVEPGGVRRGR